MARWRATDPGHRADARVLFLRALRDAVPDGDGRSVGRVLFDERRQLAAPGGRELLLSRLERWAVAAPWIVGAIGESVAWWNGLEDSLTGEGDPDPTGWRTMANFHDRPLALPFSMDFQQRFEPPRELVLLTVDQAAMLDAMGWLPARDAVPTLAARPRHGRPWPDRPETFNLIAQYQVSTVSIRALAASVGLSAGTVSRTLARWRPILDLPPRKPARNGRPVLEKGNTFSRE